ncbi:MAG: gliding motility lipoprotein GldB [Flavobacteriaceae bacterium]|nr:gliding motility lipoprotein GldB [Flavobacteriaceae bacterium]
MKHFLLALFMLFFLVACNKTSQQEKDIAQINVDFSIERFERAFASSTPEDLSALKESYPFMFSDRYPDSLWISRMQDTLQQQLFAEVNDKFKDLSEVEEELTALFQHLTYYFPENKVPRVISVTSDVDYRSKVIVTDTIVLISLDTYLGEDHEFYGSIQKYLKQNFKKEQIVSDLAEEYAKKHVFQSKQKTLLDEMIYHGKLLYFKDQVIPFKTDAEKIGYSQEELNWAMENESEIWRYFVERELLYSTDSQLPSRFINPAPFSKFYLELDAESPGRLGRYIGWQIVKAYMNNTDNTFKNMLITDAETIFKESRFKPRK